MWFRFAPWLRAFRVKTSSRKGSSSSPHYRGRTSLLCAKPCLEELEERVVLSYFSLSDSGTESITLPSGTQNLSQAPPVNFTYTDPKDAGYEGIVQVEQPTFFPTDATFKTNGVFAEALADPSHPGSATSQVTMDYQLLINPSAGENKGDPVNIFYAPYSNLFGQGASFSVSINGQPEGTSSTSTIEANIGEVLKLSVTATGVAQSTPQENSSTGQGQVVLSLEPVAVQSDISVSSLAWDPKDGGATYQYQVQNGDYSQPAFVNLSFP